LAYAWLMKHPTVTPLALDIHVVMLQITLSRSDTFGALLNCKCAIYKRTHFKLH
jgi:hypothetical protein